MYEYGVIRQPVIIPARSTKRASITTPYYRSTPLNSSVSSVPPRVRELLLCSEPTLVVGEETRVDVIENGVFALGVEVFDVEQRVEVTMASQRPGPHRFSLLRRSDEDKGLGPV